MSKCKKFLILISFLYSVTSFSQLFSIQNSLQNLLVNNATINGHIYRDSNGNGSQDAGEPDLATVGVLVIHSDNSFQVVDTNAFGDWTALVPPGVTTLSIDLTDLPTAAGRIQTEGANPSSVNAISFANTPAGIDGFFYVGALSGHLYYDKNGNGTQNSTTEPNMPNVTVTVTDIYNNIYNVVTNASGDWNVTAGIGDANVLINTADTDFPIGSIQTEGTNPSVTTIELGINKFTENDGFYERGTATGHLYFDTNGDGVQNAGEPNMPNVTVNITDVLGVIHAVVTNIGGDWTANLPIGSATVTIDTATGGFPVGATQTQGINPTTITVTINAPASAGNNGFYKNGTATGHLYFDTNGNGTQNPGEPNMPNVTVNITDALGAMHTVITNSAGNWSINLPIGNTTINIDTTIGGFPVGASQTEGTNPLSIVVLNNASVAAPNCGFYRNGTVTGHLYFDTNGNGIQNAGENNMPNVTITIVNALGVSNTVITDSNGNWSINLPVGLVTITINTSIGGFPVGATQTQGTNPSTITVLNNTSVSAGNSGFYKNGIATGHLYFDTNGDGTQNPGENNMPNVTVNVVDSQGAVHIVITNSAGNWTLTLPIGNATVTINTTMGGFPIGSLLTEGTNPTNITVLENTTLPVLINGFNNSGILKGHLYNDTNGNGIQNTGEPNISNITVQITNSLGITQQVTTDSLGNWQVTVASGSTTSTIDVNDTDFPIGAIQTQGTNPIVTNVLSNQINLTVNCGFHMPNDTDGDGIFDYLEVLNGTNPNNSCDPVHLAGYTGYVATNTQWQNADCDGDGINNGVEYQGGTDPFNPCSPMPAVTNTSFIPTNLIWQNADCDGDLLTNGQEVQLGTNPFLADTDGDGINDGLEVTNGTNPKNSCDPVHVAGYTGYVATNTQWQNGDCDGDGILNGLENTNGTDPYNPCSPLPATTNTSYNATNPIWQQADCDGDLLTNGQEVQLGTNPFLADTDGDGINDGLEVTNGTNPKNSCDPSNVPGYTGYVATNTQWQSGDCDGDGILNGLEHTNGTDPYNPCSPMPASTNTNYNVTNPIWLASDCDGEGLTNGQEVQLGTNPFLADTDGDGLNDNIEVTNGTDPNDSCDPVNAAGYAGYDATNIQWQNYDCDGDGITNGVENQNGSDPFDPCSPIQQPGYTGYDTSNPIWQNADCDGDGVPNFNEHNNGTDPYNESDNGIIIYNGISPNGDTKNDTFQIVGINSFSDNSLSIVNRWGVEVFNVSNYQNDFEGKSRGRITIKENEKLPSGTYFYKLDFTRPNGVHKQLAGYLYIN